MSRASGRASGLFRGSELPRFLILAAIAAAGWPMVLLMASGQDKPPPPAPLAIPADQIRPVRPDDGVEFQALRDKAPMELRDNAAYGVLLDRARRTPPAELAKAARRDLFLAHLMGRPAQYRGVPIHLEGTAKRVLSYEINPALAPSGRIFEAWVYSDENRALPYVLATDEAPPGLVIGPDLDLRVRFDGYFLKLLGYQAGDRGRVAPMLVGRLTVQPAAAPAPAPMVEARDFFRRHGVGVLIAALVGYVALRGVFQIRRALAPSPSLASRRSSGATRDPFAPPPAADIAPEALASFLANLPEHVAEVEGDEGEDDPDRPRPTIRDWPQR